MLEKHMAEEQEKALAALVPQSVGLVTPSGSVNSDLKHVTADQTGIQLAQHNIQPTPTAEQQHALDCILRGENVMICGGGGTGKSWFINWITPMLKERGWKFAVLAPTNEAALNIGGETLHKFCGICVIDTTEQLKPTDGSTADF